MEPTTASGAVPQPHDALRARPDERLMASSKLGISDPRPFQVDAVVALAYKHGSLLLIMAPGEVKCAVVHAALRVLRGVSIVVEPMVSVGANQAIFATAAVLSNSLNPTPFTAVSYSRSLYPPLATGAVVSAAARVVWRRTALLVRLT
jgi:hypothetical protein